MSDASMDDSRREGSSEGDAVAEKVLHWIATSRFDLAEREARRGLQRDPENVGYLALLGYALAGLKQDAPAKEAFQDALARDPAFNWPRIGLARILWREGNRAEAEQLYLDAIRLAPESAYCLTNYAILMMETGHLDKAEKLVREALRLEPDYDGAHVILSGVLLNKEDTASATEHGTISLNLAPEAATSHRMFGVVLWKSGRPFQARQHMREAVRLEPANPLNVELFERVDRSARWICLPLYYMTVLLDRVPGSWIIVAAYVALVLTSNRLGLSDAMRSALYYSFAAIAAYVLTADPLTRLWVRWRPAR